MITITKKKASDKADQWSVPKKIMEFYADDSTLTFSEQQKNYLGAGVTNTTTLRRWIKETDKSKSGCEIISEFIEIELRGESESEIAYIHNLSDEIKNDLEEKTCSPLNPYRTF